MSQNSDLQTKENKPKLPQNQGIKEKGPDLDEIDGFPQNVIYRENYKFLPSQ